MICMLPLQILFPNTFGFIREGAHYWALASELLPFVCNPPIGLMEAVFLYALSLLTLPYSYSLSVIPYLSALSLLSFAKIPVFSVFRGVDVPCDLATYGACDFLFMPTVFYA